MVKLVQELMFEVADESTYGWTHILPVALRRYWLCFVCVLFVAVADAYQCHSCSTVLFQLVSFLTLC